MDAIDTLIADGSAYYGSHGYLALIASDGTVMLAPGPDRAVTLAYLTEYPTPDHW